MDFALTAPPKTSPAVAIIFREAFKKVSEDANVKRDEIKLPGYNNDYVSPERAQTALDSLKSVDPKIVAFLKDHVKACKKAKKTKMKK